LMRYNMVQDNIILQKDRFLTRLSLKNGLLRGMKGLVLEETSQQHKK
jgi:hypothetical protein